ncbi:hypothetical protein ALC53_00846 [Atta colombica]|uniref:Uncharacterized protein n=1 Tax=Atta colombica TaxID=520822 RepID=A0A195BWQ3_9HYME|nr:hypothetical protein ALC53_00846 [Atta colombica]
MLDPQKEAVIVNLRRGSSCRIPSTSSVEESELGLRRGGSLKISRTSDDHHVAQERLTSTRSSPSSTLSLSPTSTSTSISIVSTDKCAGSGNNRIFRSARRYIPEAASDAPAPEYLARSLLQLGCPAVSMPTEIGIKPISLRCDLSMALIIYSVKATPRGGVRSEQPPSSDSDDYTPHHQQQGAGYGQNLDSFTVPKVKVSGPSNADESSSIING